VVAQGFHQAFALAGLDFVNLAVQVFDRNIDQNNSFISVVKTVELLHQRLIARM
jgi:hypothetical protein